MNLVTVSGPPSSGKTSVILKTIDSLKKRGLKVAVAKFDCLYTDDDVLYEKAGIPVKKGKSGDRRSARLACPGERVSLLQEKTNQPM